MNTSAKARPFEFLRLTSLGVIGALVKVDDSDVVTFLLNTEIIPLCLRIMETGSELSKTVATFIVQKILLDDGGLNGYICATYERFVALVTVLGNMVSSQAEPPTPRLLKHIVRCYLRLTENARARDALQRMLPDAFIDGSIVKLLKDDKVRPPFPFTSSSRQDFFFLTESTHKGSIDEEMARDALHEPWNPGSSVRPRDADDADADATWSRSTRDRPTRCRFRSPRWHGSRPRATDPTDANDWTRRISRISNEFEPSSSQVTTHFSLSPLNPVAENNKENNNNVFPPPLRLLQNSESERNFFMKGSPRR